MTQAIKLMSDRLVQGPEASLRLELVKARRRRSSETSLRPSQGHRRDTGNPLGRHTGNLEDIGV